MNSGEVCNGEECMRCLREIEQLEMNIFKHKLFIHDLQIEHKYYYLVSIGANIDLQNHLYIQDKT